MVCSCHINFVIYHIYRVGQNRIYTVYIRCFWQGNHQIYGQIQYIYGSGQPYTYSYIHTHSAFTVQGHPLLLDTPHMHGVLAPYHILCARGPVSCQVSTSEAGNQVHAQPHPPYKDTLFAKVIVRGGEPGGSSTGGTFEGILLAGRQVLVACTLKPPCCTLKLPCCTLEPPCCCRSKC